MPFGKLFDSFTSNHAAVMWLLGGAVATVMILPFILRRRSNEMHDRRP